jgi:uncharacterized protein (DUF2237 family)
MGKCQFCDNDAGKYTMCSECTSEFVETGTVMYKKRRIYSEESLDRALYDLDTEVY